VLTRRADSSRSFATSARSWWRRPPAGSRPRQP